MTEIIFLLFVAVLFIDPKNLVSLAGKAGAMYGKLQNAKRDILGQLQSEVSELGGPGPVSGPHNEQPETSQSIRAQLKRWALAGPGSAESSAGQGLAARIEALCSETSVAVSDSSDPAPATPSIGVVRVVNPDKIQAA